MEFFENIFPEILTTGEINGLTDELKMIYLYQIYKTKNRNILLITNSLFEANQCYQSLNKYTEQVYLFPMDDFLTSEALAISPELKVTRLETINQTMNQKPIIIITNLMGALRFLPPKKIFQETKITLQKNTQIDIHQLTEKLLKLGYQRETIVSKTGEIAIRGFVIDIFPLGKQNPIRIEFWGDEIDSIRLFDVDNQLTLQEIDTIEITANTEFLIDEILEIEQKQRELIKYYTIPSKILDYLENPICVFQKYDDIKQGYQTLAQEIFDYQTEIGDQGKRYMHQLEEITGKEILYFNTFDNHKTTQVQRYESQELEPFVGKSEQIKNKILEYQKNKKTIIICLSTRYQANKLIEKWSNVFLHFTSTKEIKTEYINIVLHPIHHGFIYNEFIVISERELFAKTDTSAKYKSNFKIGTKIKNIASLEEGDYVVHVAHGIGKYCGLKTLTKNGFKKDYLNIEYKDGDHLYVPVEKIEFIHKYSSKEASIPKLNKLGSTEWQKKKLKARERAESIAADLLELYAARESIKGFAFIDDTKEQYEFEKQFPYQETIDQIKVTEEIKKDMQKSQPMDRLLCGDVGYGKTEVAFRAIFKAIDSGKQVALLCPTTILSQQHYRNAIERFQNFPINICLLNRFVSTKNIKHNIDQIKEGKIDLVIGTHRLLSEDIEFKDLGLLVIDEEQRFGVKHKEKIKTYKNNIDVLTLSATPIPRTLQMSMAGIRSMSLIETPPVNRYPVQTYVLAESHQMIKDAIYKELGRNGQIFILYNRIESMEQKEQEIKQLVKEARIISIHGRMDKKEIEDRMIAFINNEYDILLCTTIIETGIDMPNVNTLIIIDADHFGLSQLYQIRGRVGRSNKIAYCYLMYSSGKTLSEIATKRLNVIKDFTELGSGFSIAMRDLSIRGAGDVLGSEQAGFIDTVGMELFLEMLNEEVEKIKGKTIEEKQEDQPLLDIETAIDDNYVTESELKIEIHQKVNKIDSKEKLEEIKKEIEDRFGKISENLEIYMYEQWFEKLAHNLKIEKVNQTKNFIELTLNSENMKLIDGETLFFKATSLTRSIRFINKDKKLLIILDIVHLERHFIYYLIELMEILKECTKK